MKHSARRVLVSFVGVFVAFGTISCSRYVRVPEEAYQGISAGDAEYWRIKTGDGRVYVANRFSINDSTLVIEELSADRKSSGDVELLQIRTPYVIDLENVSSVEKWAYVSKAETTTLVAVAVIVGVGVAVLTLIYVAFSGWTD